jgi:hypothetical protein
MGSLTPNLGLTVPEVGGDAGPAFAEEINGDLLIIDSIYGGVNTLDVGGAANVTLTQSQAQNLVQQFTGVLTGNITVFAPAVGAFYAIENATTGQFSLAFGCAGGGNVQVIPQGLSTWLWTDGSFTRLSNPPGWQEVATYTASGAASIAILLPAPFRKFRINMDIGFSANGAYLIGQTSNNGGTSFANSGYTTEAMVYYGTTVSAGAAAGGGFVVSMPTAVSTGFSGIMTINTNANGTNFLSQGTGFDSVANAFAGENRVGTCGTPFANAISFAPSAGTVSGTFIVEGLP